MKSRFSAYLKELSRSILELDRLVKKDFSPENVFDNSLIMEALQGK